MRIYRLLLRRLRRMMRDDAVTYTSRTSACVDNNFHKVDEEWHRFLPLKDGTWEIDGVIFRSDLDHVAQA